MEPINLKTLYGSKYRVILDEAAYFEPGGKKDPWYFIIPCKYGNFYPYSDRLLAYHCTAKNVRRVLYQDHPELRVRNWSDDGAAIFIFNPDHLELVSKYARPKRKRTLTQRQRDILITAGSNSRFSTGINGTKTGIKRAILR